MKLISENYISPIDGEGTFKNVFFEDGSHTRDRFSKSLTITFEMYYFKNNRKIVLEKIEVSFIGNEGDEISTNKTLYVSIDNANYDVENPESTPKITIPMFGPDGSYSFDPQTTLFEVVDFGFPTCEKVLQYFEGGTLESPEMIVTNPLAQGFVLNKIFAKGEPLGAQFQFVV